MTIATSLTPRQYAKARQISVDKVLFWIQTGQLVAVNVAKNPNGARPRWQIPVDAIQAFERRRQIVTPPPSPKQKSRPAVPNYV